MRFFKPSTKGVFSIVSLGSVTDATQGMNSGLTIDGGDPPFHRVICFPCKKWQDDVAV